MFFTSSLTTRRMEEKEEKPAKPFIPMVYEHVDVPPVVWEYRVLHINPLEEVLPTVETLNELGQQGWMLVEVLNEHRTGNGEQLHYYFMRQSVR